MRVYFLYVDVTAQRQTLFQLGHIHLNHINHKKDLIYNVFYLLNGFQSRLSLGAWTIFTTEMYKDQL
jgi:hypothetical protein